MSSLATEGITVHITIYPPDAQLRKQLRVVGPTGSVPEEHKVFVEMLVHQVRKLYWDVRAELDLPMDHIVITVLVYQNGEPGQGHRNIAPYKSASEHAHGIFLTEILSRSSNSLAKIYQRKARVTW